MRYAVFAATLAALIGLAYAETGKSAEAPELEGTSWLVEDIARRGVIDFAQTTVEFGKDGRVSGNTACNRYSGTYKLENSALGFAALISTRKACPEAVMDQEQRFLRAMGEVRSFELDAKGLLHLRNAEGEPVLRLSRIQGE